MPDKPLDMSTAKQNIVYGLTMAVLCLVYLGIFMSNGYTFELASIYYEPRFFHYQDPNQYALLGDAILHGRAYLDLPVVDALAAMDNPYNFDQRILFANESAPVYWDHAFYAGKYYCYFGVVPALALYIPFQLLTGGYLSTPLAVLILGLIVTVASCLLVVRVARAYFAKSTSTALVVVAMVIFFGACNLPYLGFVDTFYSVPILGSMACAFFGLWFWIGSKRAQGLSALRIAVGSFFMALNFGCRPQFMLACFLAFPLFYDEIFKQRLVFSKKGIKETIAAVLPFVVVLIPLAIYNQARFGSLLDFGSAYNLTIFDMTASEIKPFTVLFSIFTLLAEPPHFIAQYPFIEVADMPWNLSGVMANPIIFALLMIVTLAYVAYVFMLLFRQALKERGCGWRRPCTFILILVAVGVLYAVGVFAFDLVTKGKSAAFGDYISEPNAGGYFWLCPQTLLVLLLPELKKLLVEKRLWGTVCALLIFSAIVVVFDMASVGPNQRYFSDFAWMICLAAVICLFACKEKAMMQVEAGASSNKLKLHLRTVYAPLGIAIVFSALVGCASLLATGHYFSIAEFNPGLYQAIGSVFGL